MERTQTYKENSADRATEGLVPFYGKVMDVCMVDKTQAQMFSSVGRTRCLFQGLANGRAWNRHSLARRGTASTKWVKIDGRPKGAFTVKTATRPAC